ncbi:vacuolar protein-sorting-associated protein 36-like, partial [Contarinia nasturtii]|uniref:vacuolar protein-sorting-associated protein 36-like n=1 Tax=Contarinia nasturtii TaxID=265458 RepID=UPI0012D4746E
MLQHQRNTHRSNQIQNSQQIQSQMQSNVQNHSQQLPQRGISSTNTPMQTLTNQSQHTPNNQIQQHLLQSQQQQQQHQQSKKMRFFMAMFDYDPSTMSPNPDGCEEELPFQEGDTIK